MKWIKKAKIAAYNNPMNDQPLYSLDAKTGVAQLVTGTAEIGELKAFEGPSADVLTALVDANANLLTETGKVFGAITKLEKAVTGAEGYKSDNPLYDAIMQMEAAGFHLLVVQAVTGHNTNALYKLEFKIDCKSSTDVLQLKHATHDCHHINKKGPPL